MKRIFYMILKNIVLFPFMYLKLLYMVKKGTYSDEEIYRHLKYIVYRANKGGNVTIECSGTENIPDSNGFVLFPNHQGMYDVLAIIDTLNRPISPVIKKELKDIPMLRLVFQAAHAIAIDREDIKQSMQVIIDVKNEVLKGRNFVIFAEGTRSKNGNEIGTFKGGSFKCATKAKCPIVPVALIDSFLPFDTNSISKVSMKICYLKPLCYEDYKEMTTMEIAQLVEQRIREEISRQTGGV